MTGVSGPTRVSALDGLRGIAVSLVLFGHLGLPLPRPPGFHYGVTIFFVLSGFLITSILLEERQRTGAVSMRAFYERRARRLLPAMLVCVALALAVDLVIYRSVPDWLLAVGTIGYFANFVMMAGDWFPHTSLGVTWSLAIEEQFYLVWPILLGGLVVVGLRRARVLLTVAIVVLLGWSAVQFYALGAGYERLYFGTDVRFVPLLMGCLLAVVVHVTRARAVSPLWQVYGWLLVVVALLPGLQGEAATLVWLPAVVGVGTVFLIYACIGGRGRWLGWAPLAYLGRRSYALYLYQGAVLTVLHQSWVPTVVYWLVVVPLLLGMAELSWRWVERPVMSRGNARNRPPSEEDGRLLGNDPRRVVSPGRLVDGPESRRRLAV